VAFAGWTYPTPTASSSARNVFFCKERVELAGGKLWLAPGFTILMLLLLLVTAVGAFRLG